jgi:predicted ATPase/class 3 adenylate cyclase/DNA-binding CsgD family transcriptional regulator
MWRLAYQRAQGSSAAIVSLKGSKEDIEVVANPPTGTVTFLFTDIEGSTKLWERHPEAMQTALARHDEILRGAVEERGGYVFKTVGDAFCAAFPTAPDALEAALEIQRRLISSEWEENGPIRVRLALHTGAAEERDGDYLGPPLNRVARLLSAAHGGQVLLSLSTQELVRDQLPAGTSLRDLGEHRLKDLFRPERVFQLLAAELPSEFPPLRTLDAYRNNLPLQPTPLIGREKEVSEVCERLSRPEVRLLTLMGAGGTGKTRLGLQAAAELTAEFEDGVFFVSLAAIRDPELVVPATAGTLGVKEAGGQPLLESLEYYLDAKHILLMADNFEQVLEAAPMVSEMLSSAPNLKVLATSRIPLRLYGEHEYSVPPLALPDPEQPPPVERLTHYEAVRLFVERAQAAKADFSVTNDNAPAVTEICYRLDGLPLAIELAAARIKVLSPQKMLGRLTNPLKLLTGGARDLPERQRTLRSTIEWSYGLLEEGEKMLFARLSVFAGGCTLEAIEAICNAEGDVPMDVLDAVESLVDKSLLRQEEGVGAEPRFYMLETIHEYAREKLEESEEAEELRRLHAQYFLSLAEEAKPKINEAERDLWQSRLETEHGNLRAALRWAMDSEDSSTALRLADAIFWFWFHRGYWKEGRGWLEEALGLPAASRPTAERAEALTGVGILAWLQGDHDVARSRLEESVALCRNIQYRYGLVQSLHFLSMEMLGQGDTTAARSMAEESVEIARTGDSGFDLAIVLANLGLAAHTQNDYAVARSVLRECIETCREIGDNWLLSLPYRHLGYMELRDGNYEQATALFKEGLSALGDVKEKWFVARAVETLAISSAMQGDYVRAARLFGAGETLREAVGASVQEFYRPDYDRGVVAAREGIDGATWEEARAQGRAMTLEEAIEYALSREESTPPAASAFEEPPVGSTQPAALTRREREVAELVGQGLTSRQIASELHISEHTVDKHVANILRKLNLHSREHVAVQMAKQHSHPF